MGKFEQSVTGIEAQVCPRCLELTTRLVAAEHELHEAGKREEILRRALGLIIEGMEVELAEKGC